MIHAIILDIRAYITENAGSGKDPTLGIQGGRLFLAQEFAEVTNVRLLIHLLS
jgi:hypothetical protein